MKQVNRIAIIGAGKMGRMIARQFIGSGFCQASQLCLSSGRADAVEVVKQAFPDCHVSASNQEAVEGAELVFLCVRPQSFADVANELKGSLQPEQLVVSLITGTNFEQLEQGLGVGVLIRCSTNIGIETGNATSCWMATKEVSSKQNERAKKIFAVWGDEIEVLEEGQLEVAIVGLGSGPAYVLEAEEYWIRAMLTFGMPRDLAERVGRSVFARTTAIANQNGQVSLAELQKQVLTPGGITLRMLHILDKGAFRATVVASFEAAYKRVAEFLERRK